MNVLLDTHAFLWFIQNDSQLSTHARSVIEDMYNEVFFRVVSCWELAIKYKIGKLSLTEPFEILVPREIKNNDFRLLDIRYEHTERTVFLDMHHKDPFDRLLIAQALVENMPFISNESLLDQYVGLNRLW